MASRSDHGIRLPRPQGVPPEVRRPRAHSSLPEGLPHYEIERRLAPVEGMPVLWEHAIQYDAASLPRLAECSPPPFDPLDPKLLFGQDGPIEIEIGTGKGLFLASYAAQHPERSLLGIEWTKPIAWFAAARLAKVTEPHHARILWGDAPYFLRDRMPAASVAAFHVYFPDPWPKERARKRRVMQSPLLAQMRRLALPGCRLHWGTDHREYHESVVDLLGATPGFRLEIPDAPPTDGIMTSFERKYRKEGRPIHRAVWEVEPAG